MNSITNNTWSQELIARYEKLKAQGIIEKTIFNCKKCQDKGYTFNDKNEVVWCECKLRKDEEERLERSGLAERVKNNTFKNYKQDNEQREKAVNTCLEFLKNFKENRPSLILMGEVGAGKTHLAVATSNKLLSRYPVKYVLYDEIKELRFYLTRREYLDEKLSKFKDAPILFIDDFFKNLHKVNDYEKIKSEIEVVYEIINYRYNQKKPMIITTELNINQLMKVDKAIASRILEMSKNYRIAFDGVELNYRIFGGN
jgi:DNA replication protein DnaC